jgi:hypothetical protein
MTIIALTLEAVQQKKMPARRMLRAGIFTWKNNYSGISEEVPVVGIVLEITVSSKEAQSSSSNVIIGIRVN